MRAAYYVLFRHSGWKLLDCTAAENHILVVENDSLSRRDGSLGFIEYDAYLIPRQRINRTGGLSLVIARAGKSANRRSRFWDRKPVESRRQELVPVQRAFRANQKRVVHRILPDHIAGLTRSETKAAPLPDRIAEQPMMPSDRVPVLIQNVAVRIGHSGPAPDKPGIVSVRDKADVLTVALFGVDQFVRLRKLPCFTLVKRTEGKAKIAELLLRQHVQNIALVLLFIDSLKKLPAPQLFAVGCARIMPGGQNVISCLFGLLRYTIGQRRGLGFAAGEPRYVIGKDPVNNTLLIGPESALYRRELPASAFNWLSIPKPDAPIRAFARTRYHQHEAACTVYPLSGDEVRIVFDEPQRAITPGQAVVLYREDMVLGGGTIKELPNGMSE